MALLRSSGGKMVVSRDRGGRHHEGGTDAVDDPSDDDLGGVGAEAADHRPEGEDRQAEQQGPLAAEPVPQRPGREEQGGEDQGVGGDDPLQLAGRGLEVRLQVGQGHVEPGHRHDHHDQRQAHDPQQEPPAPEDHRVLVQQTGGTGSFLGHRPAPFRYGHGPFHNSTTR
jgi:hypothetical protein